MNRLEKALLDIIKYLKDRKHRVALIGGLGISARHEPRFTRDIDLAVAVSGDAESEEMVRNLISSGYRVLALVEQEDRERMATVRLLPPGEEMEGVVIDLLFASSGIENEIVMEAEPMDVMRGVEVPVATVGHLLALKILSRDDSSRPQDIADIIALLKIIDEEELLRTQKALKLITERGFNRNIDLHARLKDLLESSN